MGRADWIVKDVAGLLGDQAGTTRKCCLLVGAGVSRSAGIGTSADFIDLIQARHPVDFARAQRQAGDGKPTYGDCMGELTEGQQAALVREQVEQARINWAHIGIARLEAAGYVDRILTTNFDPLASRACALFNRFPAVYDLAALRDAEAMSGRARFLPAFVRGSAIYHLHGQHTGFMLLNTRAKLDLQAERIEPALEEAVKDRTVIVCGYSGENDPLVDRLGRRDVYPHGLIWVCSDDENPCTDVVEKLIDRIDDCHLVRNMPADRFFTELANALDLPQPPFLTQPFQHMLTALDHIRPYSDLTETGLDLLQHARQLLETAQSGQGEQSPEQVGISELMAQEKFEEVFDTYFDKVATLDDGEKDLVAWASVLRGNALADQAALKQGEEADALFAQAGEKYGAALAIQPDKHVALYNWGVAFVDQAKLKQGEEAEALFAQAGEKCAAALAIKPDMHEALYNWGIALANQARLKQGEEADALFAQAGEKYAAALVIKPDKHEALANWGVALAGQARRKQGEEADALFTQAEEKYVAALAIQPDDCEALNSLGAALLYRSVRAEPAAREAILNEAEEKILRAQSLGGKTAYNLACVSGLRGHAEKAADWLRTAKQEQDLPSCEHIARDRDFDLVRGEAAFVQALKDIGC